MNSTVEIIPHVHQITLRGVNIILIVEEELTLIDTGFRGSTPQIIGFIRSLGRSPEEISLILLTHNHLDHAGGLAELKRFTQAKVVLHKADISADESHLPYPRVIRKLLHIPPFSLFRPFVYVKPGEADIEVEGGEIFSPLGELEIIHTPGHTPGSISLFFPKKRLLMVGDALNNRHKNIRLPPKMVSTDLTQAVDSVKRIAQLDFDILCFGHGRPLTKDASVKLREWIR
ncbi:MAG: MBL fold metallo-hydrolase, partial [Dehalococcoidia bacterium]|nr:MBL fold metallo-hydrolase [Dehalococcoidia bacterium]